MLADYDLLNTMALIFAYMFIYNLTSFIFFTTILQSPIANFKTMFSMSNLGSTSFFTKVLAISILSFAGVPPFLGFFSKLFVFVILAHSKIYSLFISFFVLIFIGLYFYVQNLRFLNSSSHESFFSFIELSPRYNLIYLNTTSSAIFFLLFGFAYLDDILMISVWVLI